MASNGKASDEQQSQEQLGKADLKRLCHALRDMRKVLSDDVDRMLFGKASAHWEEAEIVGKALLSWFQPSTDASTTYILHEDDMKETLAKWGQWMREKIARGDSEAFRRLAVLTSKFYSEGRPPSLVDIEELPIKREKARPESDTSKEKLFARAAIIEVAKSLRMRCKLNGIAIRERMNALRTMVAAEYGLRASPIRNEEFSRCISHYKLNGLISAKSGPKVGAQQGVTARSDR